MGHLPGVGAGAVPTGAAPFPAARLGHRRAALRPSPAQPTLAHCPVEALLWLPPPVGRGPGPVPLHRSSAGLWAPPSSAVYGLATSLVPVASGAQSTHSSALISRTGIAVMPCVYDLPVTQLGLCRSSPGYTSFLFQSVFILIISLLFFLCLSCCSFSNSLSGMLGTFIFFFSNL